MIDDCRRYYAEVGAIITVFFAENRETVADTIQAVLRRLDKHGASVQQLVDCEVPFLIAEDIISSHIDVFKPIPENSNAYYATYREMRDHQEWRDTVEAFDRDYLGEFCGEKIDDELRIYIVMRRDIGDVIPKEKFGVECAHAAMACMVRCLNEDPIRFDKYYNGGQQAKIVLQVKDEKELLALYAKSGLNKPFLQEPITDAARTIFAEPTLTCIGIGPIWFKGEAAFLKRVRLYKSKEGIPDGMVVDKNGRLIESPAAGATAAGDPLPLRD